MAECQLDLRNESRAANQFQMQHIRPGISLAPKACFYLDRDNAQHREVLNAGRRRRICDEDSERIARGIAILNL